MQIRKGRSFNQSLLFIKFNSSYYTLVGGMSGFTLDIEREPVETFNCTKDYNLVIENSGVETCNVEFEVIIDKKLIPTFYKILLDSVLDNRKLSCRIETPVSDTQKQVLICDFVPKSIGLSYQHQDNETMNMSLISTSKLINTLETI